MTNLKTKYYSPDRLDSDALLLSTIIDLVDENSVVLDVGAGAGETFQHDLKGRVGEIVGVDVDERVIDNPLLDRGILGDVTDVPVDDDYFDVIFSRYVFEHIAEPDKFLAEMHRILKPNGRIIFLTPNKWHYVGIAARYTPHFFHEWYNEKLRGTHGHDVFPTTYPLNSESAIRNRFGAAGFDEVDLIFRETSPNYLLWSYPTFLIGLLYERIVNSTSLLSRFRVNILGVYSKTP